MADQREIIDQWIQHAGALANQGRFEDAIAAYKKVLTADSHNLDLRQHIISLSFKIGDYTEIIHQHMDCAEIYKLHNDFEAAIERYEEILRLQEVVQSQGSGLHGNDDSLRVEQLVAQVRPEIYHQIGTYRLDKGQTQLAMQYLKKSQELEPGRWDARMALGRAYMSQGMDKEAIGEFQEVLRLAPEKSSQAGQAHEMLGEVFSRQGREQGRSPESTLVWFRRAAEHYLHNKMVDDAIRCYEKIVELAPENKEILPRLGDLYARKGDREKAMAIYKKLAHLFEKEGLLDKVIQLLETIVKWDQESGWAIKKLIAIYESVLKRSPTNASVRVRLIEHLHSEGLREELIPHYVALAQSHLDRGMHDEAITALRQALEIVPKDVQARELLGHIYLKKDMHREALDIFQQVVKLYRAQGDEQKALEFQQKLVEIFPEMEDLQYEVAQSLRARGQLEESLKELNRIISQKENDLRALCYKAEVLEELERFEEALEVYEVLYQLSPDEEGVPFRIATLAVKSSKLELAQEFLGKLEEESEEVVDLYFLLTESLIVEGEVEKVESLLEEKLGGHEERTLTLRKDLVKLYVERGDVDKALIGLPLIPRSDRERNGLVTKMLEVPFAQGDLDVAARTIHQLPEDDPLRLSYQRRLVASYIESGDLSQASLECQRLPLEDEARSGFVSRLIGGFLQSDALEEAAQEIARLSETDPLRNSYMGQLIEAYLSAGDVEKATQEVDRLSEDDVIKPRYHRRIIQAYLNLNRFDEAEKATLKLGSDDPEKHSFLRLLIQKYLTLGKLDRVRELVHQLPDDMEDKEQYLSGLVHNYLDSGDLAGAREQIYVMAELASNQGNYLEAERLYREILAYQPADAEIRLHLSQMIASQGQQERACEGMLALAGRFIKERNVTSATNVYQKLLEIDDGNLNVRYKLGSLWAQQGQTAQALEQFAELAKVYLEQNLPEVAQKVLNRILELDPKDMEHRRQAIRLLIRNLRFEEATNHYRMLLTIHLERGEVEEAIGCVKEIVNLQPLNLELRQSLGLLFMKAGFLEQGLALLDELAEDCKQKNDLDRYHRVLWAIIESFEEHEQWETSLEYQQKLAGVEFQRGHVDQALDLLLRISEGYLVHGNVEKAEPVLSKLTTAFFDHNYVDRGLLQLAQLKKDVEGSGKLEQSLVVSQTLVVMLEQLNRWPEVVLLHQEMAENAMSLKRYDQAFTHFRIAADIGMERLSHSEGLRQLFALAGHQIELRGYEQAREVLEELQAHSQEDVTRLRQLGDLLFENRLFEEARPIYNDVLKLEPEIPEVLSRVAIIYAREGRLEDAAEIARKIFTQGMVERLLDEYKQATSFNPDSAASRIRLGKFYQQMGFVDEAIREYLRACNDSGKMLSAYNLLALSFWEKGYIKLAVRQFQRALELSGYKDEELLETRFNLACALEDAGDYKASLTAFQECYVVDIRYRDVAKRIEYLMEQLKLD